MINYPHAFYLRFFLQKGINVMIWNYRGYGRSHRQGWFRNYPTPENIREDADCVLRYMKEEMGLRGKFGVYGRSMGGIATCHLSSKVDMVIMDRTFSNLVRVIDKKFFGAPAVSVYSTAAFRWDSNNVCRLLKSPSLEPGDENDQEEGRQCYKVISCDVQDEMIDLQASLMLGVAQAIAE
jgi:hypothetical protein